MRGGCTTIRLPTSSRSGRAGAGVVAYFSGSSRSS